MVPYTYLVRRFVAATFLAGCGPIADAVHAQSVPRDEWERVVGALAADVREHYVLPDEAERLADSIEAWTPPSTGPLTRTEFIDALLGAVREWSGDEHFLLFHPSLPPVELSPRILDVMVGRACWADPVREDGAWVLGNILRLPADDRLACAMDAVDQTRPLVLDLRRCSGGSRATVRSLLGYFFPESRHFVTYLQRGRGSEEGRTRPDSRRELVGVRLAVLVGPDTASGCEAVAYHLQQLGRALVVGQVTAGAAHAVRTFDLPEGYRAFIPVIRSRSEVSDTDWEGTGVVPDVQVAPKDALEEALRRLGS